MLGRGFRSASRFGLRNLDQITLSFMSRIRDLSKGLSDNGRDVAMAVCPQPKVLCEPDSHGGSH